MKGYVVISWECLNIFVTGCSVKEKGDLFARANNAGAYSDSLALDALMRLGELKSLYRETLARLGGKPYSVLSKLIYPPSWLTLLAKPSLFFFHVNCSPSFVRRCRKSCPAQGSSSRRVTLQPKTRFSPYNRGFIVSFCC